MVREPENGVTIPGTGCALSLVTKTNAGFEEVAPGDLHKNGEELLMRCMIVFSHCLFYDRIHSEERKLWNRKGMTTLFAIC